MIGHRKQPAIFLMGPTAAGKTDAAIRLHEQHQADIISVDSALVYRGMDIGTAKPDSKTLQRAPHALIDIREPWQPYSASDFRRDARQLMQQSWDNQRIPLLAGGTMLYYKALQQGLSSLPSADETIRAELAQQAAQHGWPMLHERLQQIDPESAERIHANDSQRLSRALEVYEITGQTMTALYAQDSEQGLAVKPLKIIISPADRALLHARIEQRFKQMLDVGFLDEVKALLADKRNHTDLPAMRSVGYRQAIEHLNGGTDYEEFVYKGIVATRQLAKRQLTWLRKEDNAVWLDPTEPDYLDTLDSLVEEYLV
ncbi:tRNA (adenosine(37)-N6)-dimethylallyltransferase MiaA [Marinicella gelatinilytica]|uniref:tRNA (adenosine(37)-N6)-dimethylallyltransferase MiaA n=1 Tax=Marinicella gelatinilytica TaxID=2996017 RepID=UPI0022610094|nr:tRNA (adenosine(37)-N6)-dimethylallyltransferase MiaA [Marinicella gelatinilytica]MCX7544124.1 tRNA (adenosine(37)-N6)-dimethylallyltransferase MiaA [Marinicella gelatinilytica]